MDNEPKQLRAREIFKAAPQDRQELVKAILATERDVMHLRRRTDIHQSLLEHVKRLIK